MSTTALTLEQILELQFDAMAEDIPVDFERMCLWTCEQVVEFFESGGVEPAAPPLSPHPVVAAILDEAGLESLSPGLVNCSWGTLAAAHAAGRPTLMQLLKLHGVHPVGNQQKLANAVGHTIRNGHTKCGLSLIDPAPAITPSPSAPPAASTPLLPLTPSAPMPPVPAPVPPAPPPAAAVRAEVAEPPLTQHPDPLVVAILEEVGLESLAPGLAGCSWDCLATAHASGRPALMQTLRLHGVQSVAGQQKLANAVGSAIRNGRTGGGRCVLHPCALRRRRLAILPPHRRAERGLQPAHDPHGLAALKAFGSVSRHRLKALV